MPERTTPEWVAREGTAGSAQGGLSDGAAVSAVHDPGSGPAPSSSLDPALARAGGRDRDPAGRPRQDRPRDALGRPLPYGAPGVEPVSEEPLPAERTLQRARELAAEGRPFSAHEVLEARWKHCPPQERPFWQGLAQVCVALTHAARGNQVGAARILDRGLGRLAEYAAAESVPTYGVDIAEVADCARQRVSAGLDRGAIDLGVSPGEGPSA